VNFLQLAQRLHRETGRSGSGPASITGASNEHLRLFDAIADANRVIELKAERYDWKWMRKLLPSTASTDLVSLAYTGATLGAADFGRWRRPSESGGDDLEYTVKAYLPSAPTNVWQLDFLPYEAFRFSYYDTEQAAGNPRHWSISDAEELLIGPKSSEVHRVKAAYRAGVAALEDDGDTPTLPADFHMIIVWRALIDMGTFDAASEVLARAQRNFAEMEHLLIMDQGRSIVFGDSLA
jgi:hypothetical protein